MPGPAAAVGGGVAAAEAEQDLYGTRNCLGSHAPRPPSHSSELGRHRCEGVDFDEAGAAAADSESVSDPDFEAHESSRK